MIPVKVFACCRQVFQPKFSEPRLLRSVGKAAWTAGPAPPRDRVGLYETAQKPPASKTTEKNQDSNVECDSQGSIKYLKTDPHHASPHASSKEGKSAAANEL